MSRPTAYRLPPAPWQVRERRLQWIAAAVIVAAGIAAWLIV